MKINLEPIGFVINNRNDVTDDNWGEIISEIELSGEMIPEALNGIEEFSHLEIIYFMNKVKESKAISQFRHPRNNKSLPKLGTFAQRNKNRPNRLGLATVELVKRLGSKLIVRRLDAINGTPVLDIKPVMKEFEPVGTIQQPDWVNAIMNKYW